MCAVALFYEVELLHKFVNVRLLFSWTCIGNLWVSDECLSVVASCVLEAVTFTQRYRTMYEVQCLTERCPVDLFCCMRPKIGVHSSFQGTSCAKMFPRASPEARTCGSTRATPTTGRRPSSMRFEREPVWRRWLLGGRHQPCA